MLLLSQGLLIAVTIFCNAVQSADTDVFPDDFIFGTATAAYQIEGGWDTDGRGESIWDRLLHTHPDFVLDQANADVACDSYHLWKTDIALLKDLGVNSYRFSISWSRILPTGFSNNVSQAGLDYYNNLINALVDAGIQPLVTLYHWDLPQKLQDLGGWTNPLVADYYAEFARVAFTNFGDRVKHWLTFNEPYFACAGYESYSPTYQQAPNIVTPGLGNYLCGHTLIKGHAKAYHIYDEEFRPTQKGKVSITINCNYAYPATNSSADIEAAKRLLEFQCGWFVHPIFQGNYPDVMIERIGKRSKLEGFSTSRLPEFSEEEQAYIKGTHDFLGLNTYSLSVVKDIDEPEIGEPSYLKDTKHADDSGTGLSQGLPAAFRDILNWMNNNTGGADIMVTENGLGNEGGSYDDDRIEYIQGHLISLLDTVLVDKVKVKGYYVWSLMDNFEWTLGYSLRYGLYSVNFTDPERTRTPKKSAEWYKQVISTRSPYINVTTLL